MPLNRLTRRRAWEGPLYDYVHYDRANKRMHATFLHELLMAGVRPTSRGTWFLSSAHTPEGQCHANRIYSEIAVTHR